MVRAYCWLAALAKKNQRKRGKGSRSFEESNACRYIVEISTSCLEIDCEMNQNVVSNHEGKLVVQEYWPYWVQCFEPDEFRKEEFGLRNEQMMVGEEYCPIEAEQLDETQKRDCGEKGT